MEYAIDDENNIVEAQKGLGKSNSKYTCGGCGKEVLAYTEGEIQVPHFRHRINNKITRECDSNESYIHWISKMLFAEFYKSTSQFILIKESKIMCSKAKYVTCFEKHTEMINLKELYPSIKVEKRDRSFIPDCTIFNVG